MPRPARVLLAALLLVAVTAPPASAQAGPRVSGAGSTWSQIAVDQWRADVARQGLDINYSGVGSSAGRQFYVIGQVDFAVSEIPFQGDELTRLQGSGRSFQYLPIVAGGTSLMYNLVDASGQRVTNLQLSAPTIAGIFTGTITDWSDPAIAADNGGVALAPLAIIPVTRSDGSGTSAQFSAYLNSQAPGVWGEFAARFDIDGSTSNYPQFPGAIAQKGSDGVANYVASTTGLGAITYVEAGYALQRGFPVASVRNTSGAFTQPSARNVAIALTQATLNEDRTQNLEAVYVHGDPSTYPISSYSYMITQTSGFDPAKGKVLGDFIRYFACDGQQKAEVLGYSPIPQNLVQVAFEAIAQLPGATDPGPLEQCANPNITNTGSTADVGEPDTSEVDVPAETGAGGGGGEPAPQAPPAEGQPASPAPAAPGGAQPSPAAAAPGAQQGTPGAGAPGTTPGAPDGTSGGTGAAPGSAAESGPGGATTDEAAAPETAPGSDAAGESAGSPGAAGRSSAARRSGATPGSAPQVGSLPGSSPTGPGATGAGAGAPVVPEGADANGLLALGGDGAQASGDDVTVATTVDPAQLAAAREAGLAAVEGATDDLSDLPFALLGAAVLGSALVPSGIGGLLRRRRRDGADEDDGATGPDAAAGAPPPQAPPG